MRSSPEWLNTRQPEGAGNNQNRNDEIKREVRRLILREVIERLAATMKAATLKCLELLLGQAIKVQ